MINKSERNITVVGEVNTSESSSGEILYYCTADESKLNISLTGPENATYDLDLYATLDGRKPTSSNYDRHSRGRDSEERIELEENAIAIDGAIGILIRSYRGTPGPYRLAIHSTVPPSRRGPPVARFNVSPDQAVAGKPITFDASESRVPNGTGTYTWQLDDGTTATGQTVTHTYERNGSYEVKLAVTGENGVTDNVTKTIVVGKVSGGLTAHIDILASQPYYTGETVKFTADRTASTSGNVTSYEWSFDDGTTTTSEGDIVRHVFEKPGTYNVTLKAHTNTATDTVREEITVKRTPVRITGVSGTNQLYFKPSLFSLCSPGRGITVDLQTASSTTVDRVAFQSGEWGVVDDRGSDGWQVFRDQLQFQLASTQAISTEQVTITAYTENGTAVNKTVGLVVSRVPPGVLFVTNNGIQASKCSYRFAFPDPVLGADILPLPKAVNKYAAPGGDAYIAVVLTSLPKQHSIDLGGEGAMLIEVSPVSEVRGKLHMSGRFVLPRFVLRKASIKGEVEAAYVKNYTFENLAKAEVEVAGQLGVLVKANAQLRGSLKLRTLRLNTSWLLPGTGEISAKLAPGHVKGEFNSKLGLTQVTLVPLKPSPRGKFTVSANVVITYAFVSQKIEFSKKWLIPAKSNKIAGIPPGLRLEAAHVRSPQLVHRGHRTTSDWTLVDKYSNVSPAKSINVSELTPPGSADTVTALTADRLEDMSPGIAAAKNQTLLVWSRQSDAKSIQQGRDIFWRVRENGTWSMPQSLTNDSQFDMQPSIAYDPTSGHAVATWVRIDRDVTNTTITGPADFVSEMEVVYATYNGTDWSAPQVVTDDAAMDFRPQVAASDGEFLLAWTRDEDTHINTTADRDVRYTRITSEGHGTVKTADGARKPAVGPGNDSRFALAYVRDGAVVLSTGDTQLVERRQISVGQVSDLEVSGQTLAWVESRANQTVIRYATPKGVERVSTHQRTGGFDSLSLTQTTDGPLLVARGIRANASGNRLLYWLHDDGEWIFDHDINGSSSADLTIGEPVVATTANGFTTAFVGHNASRPTQNSDIFAIKHAYRPDLQVTAVSNQAPANTLTGDRVTIQYKVTNIGDSRLSDGFRVEFINASGVVSTVNYSSLSRGASVTDKGTITVDSTGQLTVRAVPSSNVRELSTSNNRVNLTLARPDVAVMNATVNRTGDLLNVSATIRNVGGARATNVSVSLTSNGTVVADRRIGALSSGRVVHIQQTVSTDVINTSRQIGIRAQTAGDPSTRNDTWFLWPVRPNLELYRNTISLAEQNDSATATVRVFNSGTGESTAAVLLRSAATGQQLNDARIVIKPRAAPDNLASNSTTLTLPPDIGGEQVMIVAQEPLDSQPADNVVPVAVPASFDDKEPTITEFNVTSRAGVIAVRVVADESLATDNLAVRIKGQNMSRLVHGSFRSVDNQSNTYLATLTVSQPGKYTLRLTSAPDEAGNDGSDDVPSRDIRVDAQPDAPDEPDEPTGIGVIGIALGALVILAILVGGVVLLRG